MKFIMGARSAWNEDDILTRLPPAIRERVLHHVHNDAINAIPILKGRPGGFVCAMLRQLRQQMYLQVRQEVMRIPLDGNLSSEKILEASLGAPSPPQDMKRNILRWSTR